MKNIFLVLILMNVYNLFGQNELENDPYWKFDQSKHFKPYLNTEDFFKLSGFDFCWFIMNSIHDDKEEETKGEFLSYGQKAVYYWSFVESQVTNGGFTQFYFNGYGKYVPTIVKGLRYIKDDTTADLISRSYSLYLNESNTIKDARKEGFEGFSNLYQELEHLGDLDTEYYNLSDATMKNIETFVRKNPSEFCDNDFNKLIDRKYIGDYKTYHENNGVKETVPLTNGLVNGTFKSFYENGNPKVQVGYANGEQTGEIVEFFKNGSKMTSVLKSEHNNDMIHCKYYQNGNLKSTVVHTADNQRTIQNCFKEDGTQIFKDGTGVYITENTYWEGLTKRNEMEYLNGKRHGKQYIYTNNKLSVYYEMANGKEHGKSKWYDKNGKLLQVIIYEHGVEMTRQEY